MYSKLAINNVKRSFKDYTIYFLTLTFAVCIFYTFNSIEAQKAVFQLNESKASIIDTIQELISMISIFVSFILGGLIVYANNFLIKKRKKEFGIYMTLGMGKNKISAILLIETIMIGILSLIVGLLLGILCSQVLSVFTGKLFEVSMSEYKFVISTSAITKTILYFSLMFILVMLFNILIINKYKLIDMINAARKVEKIRLNNPIIAFVLFIVSLLSLGGAYYFINKSGFDYSDPNFTRSIILGIIGSFLFFYSLAGFVLYIVKNNKRIYFKGLNIFVTKQINSKINTNFISMTIISLMLLFTIGILSSGLSFKNVLEKDIKDITPFDATLTIGELENENGEIESRDINNLLNNIGFKVTSDEKISTLSIYDLKETYIEKLQKYAKDEKEKNDLLRTYDNIVAIKLSDYNEMLMLKGNKIENLNNDEIIITSNISHIEDIVDRYVKSEDKFNLRGKGYNIKNKKVLNEAMYDSTFKDNFFTIIVPDDFITNENVFNTHININFVGDKEKSEESLGGFFDKTRYDEDIIRNQNVLVEGYTRQQIIDGNKGITTVILFIGIYLGIIFLIASAAVLALQQLSEASDSTERYRILYKIGSTEKMINRTIFTQIFIYFMLPLLLALVNAVVGINQVNKMLAVFGKPNILGASLITALVIVTIYGGYFYATYIGYKNVIKNSR